MLTSEAIEIQIDTPPPCASSDLYYENKLKPEKENTRLSRNLFHALHAFFNSAGGKITISRVDLEGNSKWKVEFLVNEQPMIVVGRNLPSLVCESAILIKQN